ncbi:MAG: DNA alkylation repair protein [Muribaculaceae bacterium]|nr:DNA alkylation repair protein [Muribaculaceae bacterium]
MNDTLKDIKHQFFAFRNGIIADALRKQTNYSVIFGLQVPQIAQIAKSLSPSMQLAETLWSEQSTRESRLLATYLFPVDEVDMKKALSLASQANNVEEADMLAFRLLKWLPFADSLLTAMGSRNDISDYMKRTLANHLS